MDNKADNSAKNSCFVRVALWILGILFLAALTCGVIYFKKHPKVTPEQEAAAVAKDLHTFPEIEFADSLYYAKTLVSYGDETPRDVFYYEKDSVGMPTNVKVHETHYYPGKKKYIDGNIANDKRDGLWYAYHKNGAVQTMAHYKNGVEEGTYVVYYENGSVHYTGQYNKGKRVGVWYFYDENEKLVKTKDFSTK